MANKRLHQLNEISSSGLTGNEVLHLSNTQNKDRKVTIDSIISYNDNNSRTAAGYAHTGAFSGKSLDNNYVWDVGEGITGITYTTTDVQAERYKVFSLDQDVHLAVDNPYWSTPDVSGLPNVDLFNGYALPNGVDSLFDYEYDYDVE